MNIPLIFITYDGIKNSVFASQVLQPLIEQRQSNYHRTICLISFEVDAPINFEDMKKKCMQYDIHLMICKKRRFLGTPSLRSAIRYVKKLLVHFTRYELIARGPLAGYIAIHASNTQKCAQITVQARGLLAEEYAYVHKHGNYAQKIMYALRTKQFKSLEQQVYGNTHANTTIEAVSPALKDYLIKTFGTLEKNIILAQHDIPKKIIPAHKEQWRTETRTQLGIPTNAHVYCYNGSAKPWQCPEHVITFFKTQYEKNNKSFLLIMTQDGATFKQLAHKHNLDKKKYAIKKVPHTQIYAYLSACDTGLIFREKHILNWISRPTKILEYQAAGLNIEHNNTIAYISSK